LRLSAMDGFFAATALAKDLTLATGNTKDFASFGVSLFNPWGD
jgi:toxin FitB